MFLCENTIYTQKAMDTVLTHELIHAFDNCRVKYNPDNVRHLACTEIRAANLSGDCFYSKEAFGRFRFKWKAHQQECVKERAVKSMLCVRDMSKQEAQEVVESVFDACFNDTEPFERIPPWLVYRCRIIMYMDRKSTKFICNEEKETFLWIFLKETIMS